MSDHQTEEQQVEAIKAFWSDNGNAIIAGLVLGFAGFIGYGYYKDNKLQQEVNTSEAYQNVVELSAGDEKAYLAAGEKFITENGESSYSALTALALAKEAASHKDWAQVATYLTTAIEKADNPGMKAIATTRLARVQIELAQYDNALTTLASTLPASFKASVEEIKGDAYLKQDKVDLARNAYQAAIDSSEQASPALQMKLDDLAQHIVLTK
ncbi:MAG: tetratricopeptide repeat protein [Thalassotalea sp.]|nr:tetratricopeptide repeat protein [Thalassotalea sp.]